MIKTLIIDDHPLFRDALELAVDKAAGNSAHVIHAGSLALAIDKIGEHSFDLILLDLNMGDSSDFDGLSKIQNLAASTKIVIVSATETPHAYSTAKSLGAQGYIPKSLPLTEMTQALKTVLNGETYFPETLNETETNGTEAADKLASLTPAQRRVMDCLSEGLLNKQIAYEMGISEATVKAHMTAIFRKLGANNRTQALLIYRKATAL